MADLARKTASIYIDHAAAEQALVKLQQQADKLSASIKKGEDAGKNMVKEISKLNDTKNQIAAVQHQIDAGLKPSFNQLQTLVAKTRAELKKMSESDPGFAAKVKDLNKYSTELNRLGTQIGAVKKESGGLKDAFKEMLPVVGWAAAGAAVVGFFKGAIDEALEADKITQQFINTLDKAGRSDAFDRLSDSANDFAKQFSFLDNDDVTNVFDKLITYGKLTEAQIKDLTPVIINFAAKSHTSLDQAATTIIKALSGSGRELEEYGVKITRTQTDTERLSLIMNDLGQKVNGAAEAFGQSTQGNIAETQQSIKDLKEEIGTGLLPVIRDTLSEVAGMVNALKKMADVGIGNVITRVKDGFVALVTGGTKALDDLNKKRNAEPIEKQIEREASHMADLMGAQTIEIQKQIAIAQKAVFIEAQKELHDFLNSSDKDNIKKRDDLLKKQNQAEANYIATKRTLEDSIATDEKNKENERKAQAIEDEKKAAEARKKSEQEQQASLRRADGYRKQALDEIAKANQQEIQLLKDKYKNEADDQDKSLAERFAAITSYNDAGLKLIATTTAGQQAALDNEIANDKKNAKSKEELAAIEQLRVAKQADIEKQNALAVSNFKIEVSQKYTQVAEQEFKKQTDLIDKNYQHQKEVADQLAKDQVNNISIDTNNQLLALDKAFQDGKIKNLVDYQKRRDAIVQAGHQRELQQQLKQLETIQGFLKFYGFKNSEIDKQVAEKKVEISNNATQTIAKNDEAALQKKLDFAKSIIDGLQQVAGIINLINQAKDQQDQAELANNQKRLDENTKKLDRELAKNLISQKEYDRQLKALQDKKDREDAVIKKREFERNKEAQILDATISGANAVINALGTKPFVPLGLIMAGLATAMVAAQIAIISKQKAPQFAKGGLIDGPSHTQGGMPVINPRTGKKVAEIEGGEPILSKKTYANNRELINQLLHASMYGNGARITPYWQQRSAYQPINYSGITRSMERVNYFAKGGVFQGVDGFNKENDHQSFAESINSLNRTVAAFNSTASDLKEVITILQNKPIKTYMLLSDANAAQDMYDRIKKETTITR